MSRRAQRAAAWALSLWAAWAGAEERSLLATAAGGEPGERIAAIQALAAEGNPARLPILEAMLEGRLFRAGAEGRLLLNTGTALVDAETAQSIFPAPANLEKVAINNRIRRALESAVAALRLLSEDPEVRLAAAEALQGADEDLLPIIEQAMARESDEQIRSILRLIQAQLQLSSAERAVRLEAAKALGESDRPEIRTLLASRLERSGEDFAEADPEVREQIHRSIGRIERRMKAGQVIANLFSGLSLGSVLLLVALGLAITYGLLGVINMAHGEMLMIGAYSTHVVQLLIQNHWPQIFDAYLLFALPVAFAVSALVGMALERTVVHHLYGRPLDTLLATWGISLLLIQGVRTLFGAQNVEVTNPSWMSGGIRILANHVLPYNRMVIIGFASLVVLAVWLTLSRTRLGLFIRGVTQHRSMADCLGVPTERVDMLAFGLGSGIAGLGGCALSQIGNVGPDLGQSYIVDSFMVVVLGGVGQLAGSLLAGLGLGVVNKFLEPFAGAVLGKIVILGFVIIFIQRRPQGLFAVKGRLAEG